MAMGEHRLTLVLTSEDKYSYVGGFLINQKPAVWRNSRNLSDEVIIRFLNLLNSSALKNNIRRIRHVCCDVELEWWPSFVSPQAFLFLSALPPERNVSYISQVAYQCKHKGRESRQLFLTLLSDNLNYVNVLNKQICALNMSNKMCWSS